MSNSPKMHVMTPLSETYALTPNPNRRRYILPNKLITCAQQWISGGFFGIESSKFSLINTKRLISRASRHLIELHFEYFYPMCKDLILCWSTMAKISFGCNVAKMMAKTTSAANQSLLVFMSLLWSLGSREKERARVSVCVVCWNYGVPKEISCFWHMSHVVSDYLQVMPNFQTLSLSRSSCVCVWLNTSCCRHLH